jgi:hypothetical protein
MLYQAEPFAPLSCVIHFLRGATMSRGFDFDSLRWTISEMPTPMIAAGKLVKAAGEGNDLRPPRLAGSDQLRS